MIPIFSEERIAKKARQAAAEGCVLLKNERETLPLRSGDRVALFGRIAFSYYKSGLGSGGLVNTRYVVSILDALKAEPSITLDQPLLETYAAWLKENPYDNGQGWGAVPWSQKEMPVTKELVAEAAARNDVALVILGRTAGEDQDFQNGPGGYLLTDAERDLLAKVSHSFRRVAVLLNVGSILDMNWVEDYQIPAVLYVWQGGQEGGNGVCDVLTGRVNPCGRLTDTLARHIEDYPSSANFGDPERNFYREDIYVGYRYFETFAKDAVLYPFGYGLSYTRFEKSAALDVSGDSLAVTVTVKNTGALPGKEAVLIFAEAPQGRLGKPARVLVGYAKTDVLAPGGEASLSLSIPKYRLASYDDSGVTGHKSCYVLEEGTYTLCLGGNVRSAARFGSFEQPFRVLSELEEALAPVQSFTRMRPAEGGDGFALTYEPVPLRTVSPEERKIANRPAEIPQTGDKGWKLRDVYDGKVSLDAFTAQLTDDDLMHIFRGEGMCSPKVTPGTAAAFGGLTPRLRDFGIPAGCCADGPSGIRMDCGTSAFSLPNGTLLGCTFNDELVEELYQELGLELRKNRIDSLLGPGMNIHRNPLNGRNFEYISEDPLLTGYMGAAQVRGMNAHGVTGTVKHFCANNQEFHRREVDAVVSERALREIYLKGFEIAVKEGGCISVMSTYGPVNGLWTAGSYDLLTTILRGEWGFDGIVMTDWFAASNEEGQGASAETRAPMVAAQNDLYMVIKDATAPGQDDLESAYLAGKITRGELQRGAKNILSFLLRSLAMQYEMGAISQEELDGLKSIEDEVSASAMHYLEADPESDTVTISTDGWNIARGNSEICAVAFHTWGGYSMTFTMRSDLGELAQLPVSIFYDNELKRTVSIQGTLGRTVEETVDLGMVFGNNHYLKFFFGADGLVIDKIVLKLTEPFQGFPV